jgi:hypothetical protein
MKDWLRRHLLFTREERLLLGGILLIFLIGLAHQAWSSHRKAHAEQTPLERNTHSAH